MPILFCGFWLTRIATAYAPRIPPVAPEPSRRSLVNVLGDEALYGLVERGHLERLGDVLVGAPAETLLDVELGDPGGEEQDGDAGGLRVGLQPSANVDALHHRHEPVEHDRRRLVAAHGLHRLPPIGGGHDLVPAQLELRAYHL